MTKQQQQQQGTIWPNDNHNLITHTHTQSNNNKMTGIFIEINLIAFTNLLHLFRIIVLVF